MQGRGVVDALLTCRGTFRYTVIAFTRSLGCVASQRFIDGYPEVELQEFDYTDERSIRNCFRGCHGVFAATDNIIPAQESLDERGTAESDLAKRLAKAAKSAGVQHFIYTSLRSIYEASSGRCNISHFEHHHRGADAIRNIGLPATILYPGLFFCNFNSPQFSYWTRENQKDTLVFCSPAAPHKSIGYVDPGADVGTFAKAAFDKGPEVTARCYPVNSVNITYESLAKRFTAVTGIPAVYRQSSVEEFQQSTEALLKDRDSSLIRDDLKAIGEWFTIAPDDMTCYGTMPMEKLAEAKHDLGVEATSWEEYLHRTGWKGPPRKSSPRSSPSRSKASKSGINYLARHKHPSPPRSSVGVIPEDQAAWESLGLGLP
ncbi:MAG: hypothetical protein M1812_007196 [Candelaria pacifica]|nr:MAG: hypothetical protein M1812_007196 [Candelaria pacifica]